MNKHPNFIKLKIELTESTITVSIVDQYKMETFFNFRNGTNANPISILFDNNEIIPCPKESYESENYKDNFVKELFDHPEEYKRYSFVYQNKRYEVLAETLLALLISQFKIFVDAKGIVNRFLFKCSNSNPSVLQRIKSSLVNIGIPNSFTPIKHKHTERLDLYMDEEFAVLEILDKQRTYNKCNREFQRAKSKISLTTTPFQLYKKNYLFKDITNFNQFYTPEKYEQFKSQFTCRERTYLKMYSLDNYCVFIAGKYFETFNDFKHLEFASARFVNNTEKYHFNPIPVTEKTITFFPNLQTLNVYFKKDKYFEHPMIKYYVNWYHQIGYYRSKGIPTPVDGRDNVIFKNLFYTIADRKIDWEKGRKIHNGNIKFYKHAFVIPEPVREIGDNCFANYKKIDSITLPTTVTKLGDNCFARATIGAFTFPDSIKTVYCNAFSGAIISELTISKKQFNKFNHEIRKATITKYNFKE